MLKRRGIVLNALILAAGVLSGCGSADLGVPKAGTGDQPQSVAGGGNGAIPAAVATQAAGPAVPKARCGPNDRVETGLQGQITVAERVSGASEQAYNCNLDLVGQFEGEGASWQLAWSDQCAYYDTANNPLQQHLGTVVIDASDPSHPQATSYLDDPGMLDPWEGLKVNARRKLLAGIRNGGPAFSIFDVSGDCRHPVLLANLDLPGTMGHAGDFAPDGRTYYASQSFRGKGGIMPIIDVSDPSNPKNLLTWKFPGDGRPHDPSFNEDGTRLYSPQPGQFGNTGSSIGPNGLVVLDTSDIQYRRPDPQITVVSTLFWVDGGQSQMTQFVRIKGKPFLIFTDELGAGGVGGAAGACARNLPPWGFARIIDISDELNPRIISKLMLEVHDPANCPLTLPDLPFMPSVFGYDSHYCKVDNPKNAKLLACSYFGAGVRVFDIRDPYTPKEIAYYKPPARRTAFKPGSQLANRVPDRTNDWASSNIRFVRHEDDLQLWFTSQDNGFQVVKFTNRLKDIADDEDDDQDSDGRDGHGDH